MNFAQLGKTNSGDCMNIKKAIRIFDAVLLVLCTLLFSVIIWATVSLPDSVVSYDGDYSPFSRVITYTSGDNGTTASVDAQSLPNRRESLKLFGIVPVKEVTLIEQDEKTVLVSGEVFGIKLYTDGVIIVGTQSVDGENGRVNPAEACGLQVGDVIISINGQKVFTSDTVHNILNDNNGSAFDIKVKRGERYREFSLTPVYCEREGCFKAGMWVRDSTAGIGTLTYYDKDSGMFGALGHQINDVDTNEIMPLLEGEAVSAKVTDIQRPSKGVTGSLECDFGSASLGRLTANTNCGIFGAYSAIPDCAREYPIASVQQVKKGKATLISTVEGVTPREYDIEITRISYNDTASQKNMVVKITDPELKELTGGIVQGMSGSPIVQDGRLVGALTHVIVNSPDKGYAVFAQAMLEKQQAG